METTRVLAYCRVSTEEQSKSGHSIDAQKATIAEEIERRGWSLVELVEENGSGKSLKRRPGLQNVLERLAAGEADVLVSTRLDRLTRSVADLAELIAKSKAGGWSIATLDMELDMTTASGKAMAQIIGVFGEWERDMLVERTKAGLEAARAKGIQLGRPRVMAAKTRRRILRERSRGDSFATIASGLNDDGVATAHEPEPGEPMVEFVHGKRWYPSTVRHVTLAG